MFKRIPGKALGILPGILKENEWLSIISYYHNERIQYKANLKPETQVSREKGYKDIFLVVHLINSKFHH
jgi:hypothetical protein